MTRRAVLFLTHKVTQPVVQAYRRLRDDLGADYLVYLVVNGTAVDPIFLSRHDVEHHMLITTDELRGMPYPAKINRDNFALIPGNPDLITLLFAQKVASEFYWQIEYDVDFSGNWRNLISYFDDNSQADLLGSTMFPKAEFPNWFHWPSLRTGDDVVAAHHYARCFIPIQRVSHRGLVLVDSLYRRRWAGHFEAALPTMFLHAGLTIEDFGGDGPYVRPENINRFYWNTRNDSLSPGTLTYRPVIATEPVMAARPFWKLWGRQFAADKIWHPIKI